MTVRDLAGRVVRGIDLNATSFQNSFKQLPSDAIRAEVIDTIRGLLGMALDQLPARLHLHQLTNRDVPARLAVGKVAAWSLHVTADDRFKASFTVEGGSFYFRLVDKHDTIDKRP